MNLANKLTVSRIVLTFIFMFFLFMEGVTFKFLALGIFIAACITDLYDGRIARKRNMVTSFGKLMDPIADKVLTLGAFLAFVELGLVPAWMVVLIILRELIITCVRFHVLTKGEVLVARKSGKHKTVSQMVSIFAILIFMIIREIGVVWMGFWTDAIDHWSRWSIFFLMLVTVIFTLISGISFLVRNRKVLI
ncbi:MAG: CDP-diacylglycerol--glycerol-3-phosphate 3-phosphatidyltransferase [Candidatus Omnitrophica bacterium]|nr:CDP-diacylglycerol--glycerol-3-phosphate 3-phosphatidyltransferase [Candidatus Omnitrophota bacterium]